MGRDNVVLLSRVATAAIVILLENAVSRLATVVHSHQNAAYLIAMLNINLVLIRMEVFRDVD